MVLAPRKKIRRRSTDLSAYSNGGNRDRGDLSKTSAAKLVMKIDNLNLERFVSARQQLWVASMFN
jgi:hypothetical protein